MNNTENTTKLEEIKKVEASVKKIEDFTDPEKLHQELLAGIRKYHPSADLSMIEKAYQVAAEAHKDQKRKSGEPYICLLYTSSGAGGKPSLKRASSQSEQTRNRVIYPCPG